MAPTLHVYWRKLGDLKQALNGRIATESVFCKDRHSSCREVPNDAVAIHFVLSRHASLLVPKLRWDLLDVAVRDSLSLRSGNARHTVPKTMINRAARRVSTKHLELYVYWAEVLYCSPERWQPLLLTQTGDIST